LLLQVTVAILLNSFVGAINSAEEEAAAAALQNMKSKEMLRSASTSFTWICLVDVKNSKYIR
jgi:hypothetical protein